MAIFTFKSVGASYLDALRVLDNLAETEGLDDADRLASFANLYGRIEQGSPLDLHLLPEWEACCDLRATIEARIAEARKALAAD